ncbi:MAG: hypothetical protein Q8M71_09465 [Thermodesulfovibrionales bacterium]|nr:hypothetical protein [Thermodesulfovibrionales bacterium]
MPLERFENIKEGGPTLNDLENGRVFLDKNRIERVENLLQRNRICIIRGAEGRGKTVLARVIGFNKYKQGWKVYFIDVSEMTEEEVQLCCFNFEELGVEKTLFIIENAHQSLDEITPKLVEAADTVASKKKNKISFIFTSRKILPGDEQFILGDPFEEWVEKRMYEDLTPDTEIIKGIIETFIATTEFSHNPNPISDEDLNYVYNEVGTNLRRLSWYLKSWCKIGGPLSSVTKKMVLEEIIRHIFVPLKDAHLQEMLVKVSAVFQYDINFYGQGFDHATLHKLVKRGEITFLRGDYYKLQHSSDADYIVEAWAFLKKKAVDEITTELLQKYLQKKPVNYHVLLRALYRNKEQEILSNIFEDDESCAAISDMIKNSTLSKIGDMILLLPEERAKSFVQNLDPVKLAEKVKTQNLQKTMWFLKSLSKDASNKDSIKAFLSAIPKKELAEKMENSEFSVAVGILEGLPEDILMIITENINPVEIAKTAKIANLQKINWFLWYFLKNPSNKDFLKAFLSAITEESLLEKMKNSSIGLVLRFMNFIKQIDSNLHRALKDGLSPSEWLQIWLSSGLNAIAYSLGRYCNSIGDDREFAQSIISSLSSKDLSESIKKLYQKSETQPLEVLGRLLYFAYQIAFETNPEAVKKLAQQIIQEIDLTQPEKYNLEQLTLLVGNVEKCDETLCKELCSKILSDINLDDYVTIPFDKKLAILLWQLNKYDPSNNRLQLTIKNIFNLDFKELLNNSETEAVSLLIWNMLQIDPSSVQDWIKNIEIGEWIQKAKSSSTYDSFWLLWSLYHTNKELSKNITPSLSEGILPSLSEAKADDLALLGFFIFCGIQLKPHLTVPPAYEIADKLSESLGLSKLAFSLLCLQKCKDGEKLIENFIQELARCLTIKHLIFSIQELLSKHPFDITRQVLQDALKDFYLPAKPEPEIIFTEMVRLTQSYLKKKRWKEITFSYLRDYFLSNPPDNPIFSNVNDSQRWLNIAMQYGIYSYRETPHPKDPDGVVTWLSLNKDNPLVASVLMSNRVIN